MDDDYSSFKGREQYFYMFLDGERYVKINDSSVELKKRGHGEGEGIPGSILYAKERKPDLFSIHDRTLEEKSCLTIDPEWKGQKDTETLDEINNLVTNKEYESLPSQLFRLVRVDKKETRFHMVSQLKDQNGQYMAMILKHNKLRIATYDPKNDDHEISLTFLWHPTVEKQVTISVLVPVVVIYLLVGLNELLSGEENNHNEYGNESGDGQLKQLPDWAAFLVVIVMLGSLASITIIIMLESRRTDKNFSYKKNQLEYEV